MRKKILLIVFLAALLSIFPEHLLNSGFQQSNKDQKTFQYEVTVVLKLVQVYVTDKKGNPVIDLTRDDFILYDNGKFQTITDFEKHILAQPRKSIEEKVEEKTKEAEPPSTPLPPSRMNRKFLLLLDLFQTDAPGIKRSKKAALHFIDTQLQPTDEVGIFSYTQNQGLVLNEYLTIDHQRAREAVEKIKSVPGRMYDPFEDEETEAEREFKKMRAGQFAKDMKELAKSLRYIPGIKHVILFSGGISRTMLYDRDAEEDALGMAKTNPELRVAYEEMSKELASSNTPVYTVNTIGTRRLLEQGGGTEELGDHSLRMLSDISGGEYFGDVTGYEAIAEKIQNVTSNYYVLGYYIDEKWDGKYHNIKVEVKRKGCEAFSQRGYFNPKAYTEFSEFEKRFHLMDLALSGSPYLQDPSRFPLISLPCSNQKEFNLVLISEIPVEKIKETPAGEKEMVTLVFNEENSVIDSTRGEVDFTKIPQQTIYHYSVLSLSPGRYKCRVVIRDLETGMGFVASSSATIPEDLESGLKVYPPLLLIPEKEAHYLKAIKDSDEKTEIGTLSLNHIYPFLSNRHAPLTGELEQGTSYLLAILRCSALEISEPEVNISAYLIEKSSGEKIQLSLIILSSESKDMTDVLFLELQLPELKSSEYSLGIIAEEARTGSRSEATRLLRVK